MEFWALTELVLVPAPTFMLTATDPAFMLFSWQVLSQGSDEAALLKDEGIILKKC